MHLQHRMSALVGITLLFAAASFAQQVKTDYDRSADFGQYKTYSWEKVQTRDPLMVDRIETAVNADLASKGWKYVKSGGDVSIIAIEITQNQQTLNTFYDGFGGGWGWRGWCGGRGPAWPVPAGFLRGRATGRGSAGGTSSQRLGIGRATTDSL